jgi:hypothetical protein
LSNSHQGSRIVSSIPCVIVGTYDRIYTFHGGLTWSTTNQDMRNNQHSKSYILVPTYYSMSISQAEAGEYSFLCVCDYKYPLLPVVFFYLYHTQIGLPNLYRNASLTFSDRSQIKDPKLSSTITTPTETMTWQAVVQWSL